MTALTVPALRRTLQTCILCCGMNKKKELVNVQTNREVAIANPVGDTITSTELVSMAPKTATIDSTAPEIPSLMYLQKAKT